VLSRLPGRQTISGWIR